MLDAVTLFCGARCGRDPAYAEAARAFGREVARRGIALWFGAGRIGLMGEAADAALAAGGRVVGVIPEFLKSEEVVHPRLAGDDLVVTRTLFERKRRLIEPARAFVVLPGGLGTLDELFEVVTLRQLKEIEAPCGLLDVRGFFQPLLAHLRRSVEEGFLDAAHLEALLVADDAATLLDRLDARAAGRGLRRA